MKVNIMVLAKTLALSIAAIAIFTLSPSIARADTVSFTTFGCFGAGCTPAITSTATFGGLTLTFNNSTRTVSTPTFGTDLGTITAAGVGSPTGSFTLRVQQTSPPPGGSFDASATLTGSITSSGGGTASTAMLVFNQATFNIGGIIYTLQGNTNTTGCPAGSTCISIVAPPPGGSGQTPIKANVSGSAVPEPASLLLLGTGLTGLAGVARRRMKRNQ